MAVVRKEADGPLHELRKTLETIQWLADSNYELEFPTKLAMSERIIFPVSPNETNGIEDARFVKFTEDDGTVMYYATYTAYNGRAILPQLIDVFVSNDLVAELLTGNVGDKGSLDLSKIGLKGPFGGGLTFEGHIRGKNFAAVPTITAKYVVPDATDSNQSSGGTADETSART